jgi:hypothetical protein
MVLVAQYERGAILCESVCAGGPDAGHHGKQHAQQASKKVLERCHGQRQ